MEELKGLVEGFKRNIDQYKSATYDEYNTRSDFIDKLFARLGWDVYNKAGYSEEYKDVVREDKVYIKNKPKSPDYSFRIGRERVFFVEAKKPSVNIKEDIKPAFQLRRYAYTAGLKISILTDFEEFAIYDTTIKPNETDKASVARIFYCTYDEYEENWEFLNEIISKIGIQKGNLKNYVKSDKKKGTQPIDKELLKLIETWREELAKNIALRNKNLNIYELNEAVQKIIDRIIFLRMAEDRNTEIYGNLKMLAEQDNLYDILVKQFNSSNKKYNSGLFKIQNWLDNISVDDKILKDIISDLYYPNPYEFSVLPIEVLGQIYEQFLGKTIKLTKSHRAKIEEKPEVRKAGGVYYTPRYIVDYIVENTVGEKIKRKSPDKLESLTILDPACGSGSFLVAAYKFLIDFHLQYWTKKSNLKEGIKLNKIYQASKGNYRLTIRAKKSILLNNIYGVDIDSQAVEVTKLSLLLTLMEGEIVESSTELFLKNSKEALLPDLESNIKCGNSLISSDFYEDKELKLFDEHELRKINTFDWEERFKSIFDNGGFDCVIGNPPYVKLQTMMANQSETIPYLKSEYVSATSGNIDLYLMFLEKAHKLISKNGTAGYILPHKFFQAQMGESLRNYLAENNAVKKVISFGANQIFESASTYTCLFFINNKRNRYIDFKEFDLGNNIPDNLDKIDFIKVPQKELKKDKWNFYDEATTNLFDKLDSLKFKLKDVTRKIFVGLQTSADKIYVLKRLDYNNEGNILEVYSKSLKKNVKIEKDIVKPFLMGKDVKRYKVPEYHNYVIFPYNIRNGKAILMSQEEISNKYPLAWKYLNQNKEQLEGRESGKMKGSNFYAYIYPKNLTEFESKKIMTPYLSNKCNMTYDNTGKIYHTTKAYSLSFNKRNKYNEYFYLGILNSQLIWFFISNKSSVFRGGYYVFARDPLEYIPLPNVNLKNKSEKEKHDKLVELVDQMLDAQKEYHNNKNKSESEEKFAKQRIKLLDNQINNLVYDLYELTRDEIKIVEGE